MNATAASASGLAGRTRAMSRSDSAIHTPASTAANRGHDQARVSAHANGWVIEFTSTAMPTKRKVARKAARDVARDRERRGARGVARAICVARERPNRYTGVSSRSVQANAFAHSVTRAAYRNRGGGGPTAPTCGCKMDPS